MVGRLVEQQQVGLGEQHGGERHAHAPAAGEAGERPLLRLPRRSRGRRGSRRPRRRGMGADVGEPGLDLGDGVRLAAVVGRGSRRARS